VKRSFAMSFCATCFSRVGRNNRFWTSSLAFRRTDLLNPTNYRFSRQIVVFPIHARKAYKLKCWSEHRVLTRLVY